MRRLEFVDDSVLRYAASRHVFVPGAKFALGPDYRLAHLPLVAPGHPQAIRAVPGKDYCDGRYARSRAALVAHVPIAALEASPAFRELEAELKAGPVGVAIAWDIGVRRQDSLHATIVGPFDPATVETVAHNVQNGCAGRAPAIRLGGPFVGDRNHGRIYLPVYPERIDGQDAYADLQRMLGARTTGFYAVGLWHLTRDLAAFEAAALAAWLDRHRTAEIVTLETARLAILTATDDLALHSPQWRWIDGAGAK
jgi:hypothetical protein